MNVEITNLNTAQANKKTLIIYLSLIIVYLYAFWPSLVKMELIWRNSETYMHCYLILPISIWLLLRQKTSLKNLTLQPTIFPVLLSIPIALVWLSAYAINVNFVSQFAAIIYLQLMIWSFIGHNTAKKIWFPICFLIFLVPFGESINPLLQQITADLVVYMLHMIDLPVFRDGLYLYTPSAVFEVAIACSGLNFLLTSMVLSCLFAYLNFSKWYKAALFILFVVSISVIANGIRAFLLVVIGDKTNLEYGFGADHYYYGWIVFFIVIFSCFYLGSKFADEDKTSLPKAINKKTTNTPKSIVLAAVMLITLALAAYSSKNMPVIVAPEQPESVLNLPQAVLIRESLWGITFYDGLARDHWRLDNGTEYFQASYAHRQHKGDMLTWHNRLYDLNFWSINETTTHGNLFDNYAVVTLSSIHGERKVLVY